MKNYIEAVLKGILIGSIAVFIASTAQAKGLFTADDDPQAWCLAQNIYYEARGSSLADAAAVSDVVINRVQDTRYPNTICAVVQQGKKTSSGAMKRNACQFSWYCDGKSDWPTDTDSWVKAQELALSMILYGKYRGITEGATHYHAHYVNPRWARSFDLTGTIGDHKFYRWNQ